jgi:hypothetical protein
LKKGNITPNFYVSAEYFEKAGLKEESSEVSPISFVMDEDWMVFPPINTKTFQLEALVFIGQKVWSDFPEWKPEGWEPKFLDLEYIYDPTDFLCMEGGKWQVFRKNCRKWPNRTKGNFHYHSIAKSFDVERMNEKLSIVLENWLESKSVDDKIMDDDVLLKYLFYGENRKILYDNTTWKIKGINIWDENYKYINYRYCICQPEEFLSEYMRWLFYTDSFIFNKNKLVNDGGVLDSSNLKKFKDKMNPLQVREVNSWIKKEDL